VVDSGSARRVLLVVATLGQRQTFLRETLESIRDQSVQADVVVVAPAASEPTRALADAFGCRFVPDPGSLTGAINLGVAEGLDGHDFVNWLNDDDLLEPGSLEATTGLLDSDPAAVVAYGACRYIDGGGRELWISRAGPWASRILSWGPDLIPQPGMLVRTSAWSRVGGLDESYRFAFDLDLLLRLKALGTLRDTGAVVSAFRWHEDSLTVGDRSMSLAESERAKRAALGPTARRLAWTWEGPVRLATRAAAREVSRRARRVAARHG
jgi:GT2 family glycosyltransferase